MNKKQIILFWVISAFLTIAVSLYQRMTGPTYPVSGTVEVNNQKIEYKLARSHAGDGGESVCILVKDRSITGKMTYRRFNSFDDWTNVILARSGDTLIAEIPHQLSAGKVQYNVTLIDENRKEYPLRSEPVIIRFRSDVPAFIVIVHVILIFFAMMLSNMAGFKAFFKDRNVRKTTNWTVIVMLIGGLIFGPLMQYYAFGEFWTGWPIGHDLTDNKMAVAIVFWLLALWRLRKNPESYKWVIIASIVTLVVYLIPHSVLGSELDYTKMPKP